MCVIAAAGKSFPEEEKNKSKKLSIAILLKMESGSGSWYAYYETWYYFHKSMSEHTQDDTPEDYEEEVQDPRVSHRFRYCHVLLDHRKNLDFTELCIPEEFKLNRGSKIFNFIDSTFKDEINKDVNKFLIIIKFREFRIHDDSYVGKFYYDYFNDDNEIDVETGLVPASKSSIKVLEEVSDLSPELECVICLEEGKKKAKRMPCGHAFHGRCIEEWLGKSNLCPLYRYVMSRDS
ncbi:hypothetical protein GQ457_11G027830 [Hibiscus cannabinus]